MNKDFSQIQQDVTHVIEVNENGKNMAEIAEQLDLSIDYIKLILTCAQGFTEDDTIAVAHLVEMEF